MAVNVSSNANEIVAELGRTSVRTTRRLNEAVREAGTDMRDEWRSNAEQTSGAHGRLYPPTIKANSGWLVSEIGSDSPAAVGYEFGSMNQPAHLDGQLALDSLAPRINRRFDIILSDL